MNLIAEQVISTGGLTSDYSDLLKQAQKNSLGDQVIKKNVRAFGKKEKTHQKIIMNRLGWLDVIRQIPSKIERIENLIRQVREAGTRHLLILGMGGSSLCPEVFGKVFEPRGWLKSYEVIDTTAPSRIDDILKIIDLEKSFFIISSKSGTTIETVSQFRFFFRKIKEIRPLKAGNYFAAITDEGSDLHRIARRNRFRETFINNSDIGGRYSALSFFGLVPGAFTRADLSTILDSAEKFLTILETSPNYNDALMLGVLMAGGAHGGKNLITFRASPTMAAFIPWIEQLVAESTGKEKKGIIPVEGEPADGYIDCAPNRIYVSYFLKGEANPLGKAAAESNIVHPTVNIELDDPHALGAEILKWEMATTIASILIKVNPFDEPNVAESKKNTAMLLEVKTGHRKIIPEPPLVDCGEFTIKAVSDLAGVNTRKNLTAEEIFESFVKGAGKSDYISILAYTEMLPDIEACLRRLRKNISDKNCVATLRGYGPRFLHSIGQLYKGGDQRGHFLVMERDYDTDYTIPKLNFSFGRLIKAQAEGDIKALKKRKRPLIHISLKSDPVMALEKIIDLFDNRQ